MFSGFFQHHGQLEFVIQLLRQVRGIDDRIVGADDGIHVLKKDDPRQHRMRKSGALRFFVVFAKISGGMEKFFRLDGRAQLLFAARLKYQCLAAGAVGCAGSQHELQRFFAPRRGSGRRLQIGRACRKAPGVRDAIETSPHSASRRCRAHARFKSTMRPSGASAPCARSRCGLKCNQAHRSKILAAVEI